ncbi:MAG TPA: hypothetical protein VFJ17_01005 [Mycobacteriales bacterium]|nr:hypothetical protein [Mycobacteriales bacterium]
MFVAGRRRGLGIGLLTAGMVVLSACSSGGSAPRSLPALSTTPAAATSTAPPTSKAAELAAVKAVVRRYYALANQLHRTMDADPLAQLMTPDCSCRQQIQAIRSAAAVHNHYVDTATITSLTPALDSATTADVLVEFDAGVGGLVDASGRVITKSPPRKGIRRLFLLRLVGHQWLIAEIRAA